MSEYSEEVCRLCLTTEKSRSYYFLLDLEHLETISLSFALDSDLQDPNIHPKHICDECNFLINRFFKLKQIATENDVFIINYQDQIHGQGITVAMEKARKDNEEETENNKNVTPI